MSWRSTVTKIVLVGGAGVVAGVYLEQTYKLPNAKCVEANFNALKETFAKATEGHAKKK